MLSFYETSSQWAALNESIKGAITSLESEMLATVENEGDTIAEIIATQEEQKFMRAKSDQLHRDATTLQKQKSKLVAGTTALHKSIKKAEAAAQQKEKQV